MTAELQDRLASYLEKSWPQANNIEISGIKRFFGGASKPTYRFDVTWDEQEKSCDRSLVLRLTPEKSLVDHSFDIEADALGLAFRHGIPVPQILGRSRTTEELGRPFFMMEEISGCEAQPHLLAEEPYASLRPAIGKAKWEILGRIAAAELTQDDLALFPPTTPETCWQVELDKWDALYHRDTTELEPLVEHAIRWLRKTPPPSPPKLSLVHGDYRTGNFLFDQQGRITAILDWEMAHIGDAIEDLAWAMSPTWGWPDTERPGHLIQRAEAISIWEQASGRTVDPVAFHWWSVLITIKCMDIWCACTRSAESGDGKFIEFCGALTGYDVHMRILADLLARRSMADAPQS